MIGIVARVESNYIEQSEGRGSGARSSTVLLGLNIMRCDLVLGGTMKKTGREEQSDHTSRRWARGKHGPKLRKVN
jgi:hypothetical protein